MGWGCTGISWTIRKQSAPRSRQITTATPHHSIFYRSDALPDNQTCQPIVSKHSTLEILTQTTKVNYGHMKMNYEMSNIQAITMYKSFPVL